MKYALILLLSLTGCTKVIKEPFVVIKPDIVEPISVQSPEWKVVNQNIMMEISNDQTHKNSIFYLLDQEQFKQLMESLSTIADKLIKQDKVIKYYENAIDEHNLRSSTN